MAEARGQEDKAENAPLGALEVKEAVGREATPVVTSADLSVVVAMAEPEATGAVAEDSMEVLMAWRVGTVVVEE